MSAILRQIRHAIRRLAKTPGFAAIAVLTLALGIGGTTAVFSIVDAVLLRPLPYRDPGRLVGMWHTAQGLGIGQIEQSEGTYLQYQKATRSFESIGGYRTRGVSLTGTGEPEQVQAVDATASLFPTLGVSPALGRTFVDAEDQPHGPHVAVISDALWRRRFAGERGLIGQTIRIDGTAYEVVGVMPPTFTFPDAAAAIWIPMAIDRATLHAESFGMNAVGRLRPHVSLDAAAKELQPLLLRMPEDFPSAITRGMLEQTKFHVALHPLRDDVVGNIRPVLLVVLGTVVGVLLIACANVANLFLVRAEGRQRELAVRTAIGARPGDLVRLSLGESGTLTAAGTALGMVLAWAAVEGLLRLAPAAIPRAGEIGVNARALLVAVVVAIVASTVFGLVPLVRPGRSDLVGVLRDGSRGATSGREGRRVRDAFVIVQVALALVLLVGSGLLARSFWRMRAVDPGIRAAGVLTLRLQLPGSTYPSSASRVQFWNALLDRVGALPGVAQVGLTGKLPLRPERRNEVAVWAEDRPVPANAFPPVHLSSEVSGSYFATIGIPLLAGHTFARTPADHGVAEAIIGRAVAEQFWPHEPLAAALGKRVRIGPNQPWLTVVGVVADVHDESLTRPADGMLYRPISPLEQDDSTAAPSSMALVVRAQGGPAIDPSRLTGAIRREIGALDPDLPLVNVRAMPRIVADATARTAFTMLLLGVAAGVALLLGGIGLYGVIAYMVSLRTREIGVRMALGAQRTDVGRMIVGQGVTLATIGVGIGLAGALVLTRLIASLLYGVAPTDPPTIVAVSLLLLMVAALASWLPARRAASIDPVMALRSE